MSQLAPQQGIKVLSDSMNALLGRREVRVLLPDQAGRLTRPQARERIASLLNVEKEKVVVTGLKGSAGSSDLVVEAYVYDDVAQAKLQLPEYIWLRNLPKEERRRALEEMRKKRAELKAKEAQK